MSQGSNIDGLLITWGDRLFYPGNRVIKGQQPPKLVGDTARARAAAIRRRIAATVSRRAPQVMVKVTGGGRGMKAIAAHFRYISKNGRIEIEDQRRETLMGKESLRDLAEEWRLGGSLIPDDTEPGHRREAFNIMLSMPRGTDPLTVLRAAREFAQAELADHKYVMVLHDHQAHPHVHLSVRAESRSGMRLNPRKADLHRWRETFAEKLRGWGVEAEATRQVIRGRTRAPEPLWKLKAGADGRLPARSVPRNQDGAVQESPEHVLTAWTEIGRALSSSSEPGDRDTAKRVEAFLRDLRAPRTQPSHLHRGEAERASRGELQGVLPSRVR